TNNDDAADGEINTRDERFERGRGLELTFAPRATTILTLKLKTPGTPYWSRPDLGIDREDVTMSEGAVHVRVHSLGSVDAPPSTIAVRDRSGKIIASAAIPALPAPNDLRPKTADVVVKIPGGFN